MKINWLDILGTILIAMSYFAMGVWTERGGTYPNLLWGWGATAIVVAIGLLILKRG